MRHSFYILLVAAALTGCGSGDGSGGGVSKSTNGLTGGCPNFNGTYASAPEARNSMNLKIQTQMDDGVYSYRFNDEGPWILANGSRSVFHANEGTVVVMANCGTDRLMLQATLDQNPTQSMTLIDLGGGKMQALYDGMTFEMTRQ